MTTVLPVGTKENLIVDVTDRLANLTTLDGTNPTFDVRLKGATTWILDNEPVVNIGMRAFCLIDTDGWDVGTYQLFIDFTAAPEAPRMGPVEFEVANA